MIVIYSCINVSFLEEYLERLQSLGFKEYQIIEQVLTMTTSGTPRLNTAVWPGYSSYVIIQCFDETKKEVYKTFIEQWNFERMNNDEKIKYWMHQVNEFFWI